MFRLLQLFIDICLFRAKPQELPSSRFLLGITMAAVMVTNIPLLLPHMSGIGSVVAATLLGLFLKYVFLQGGLYLMEVEKRFLQTATAMFGAEAVINLPGLMLEMMLIGEQIGGINALGALFRLLLLFWSLAVMGHILRHALDIRFALGVVIAVIYTMLLIILIQQLMPATV